MKSKKKINIFNKLANSVEVLALAEFKPYAKNTRLHDDFQINQIVESIKEFGFTNPILVDDDNNVIAGHGRLEAAKRLGMQEAPIIRLSYLDEKQKRAYIIADNKIAENASWDIPLLTEELKELDDWDVDLNVIGFSDEELDKLLSEVENLQEDMPEKSQAQRLVQVCKLGDTWLLGDHKLEVGIGDADFIVENWQKKTKQNARLQSNGKTYHDILDNG